MGKRAERNEQDLVTEKRGDRESCNEGQRENGWETGIRTPISRVRVCCPAVRRSPSRVELFYLDNTALKVKEKSLISSLQDMTTPA